MSYQFYDGEWVTRQLSPRYISKIEPAANASASCTAVVRQTSYINDMAWIKIPCDTQHESASYICEFASPDMAVIMGQTNSVLPRSYAECAQNLSMLFNVCISMHSVILQNSDALLTPCAADGAQLFRPADYITSKPTTAWTTEERMAVQTLQNMNHRWPSVLYRSIIVHML